jgi:hypothetical protein
MGITDMQRGSLSAVQPHIRKHHNCACVVRQVAMGDESAAAIQAWVDLEYPASASSMLPGSGPCPAGSAHGHSLAGVQVAGSRPPTSGAASAMHCEVGHQAVVGSGSCRTC